MPAETRLRFGEKPAAPGNRILAGLLLRVVYPKAWKQTVSTTIDRYEATQGAIPAAVKGNKRYRVKAIMWVLQNLPPAESLPQIKAYLALTVIYVEQRAFNQERPPGQKRDNRMTTFISLKPKAYPGTQIMFSEKHVTVMAPNGALQIQPLPPDDVNPYKVDYRERASQPGMVVLDKAGADGKNVWGVPLSEPAESPAHTASVSPPTRIISA